jgi:hypothetical protein
MGTRPNTAGTEVWTSMKIREILATRYVHPDVDKILKKYEKRAKGRIEDGLSQHDGISLPRERSMVRQVQAIHKLFKPQGILATGTLRRQEEEK